ncbi:MAG: transcriptional regulator, partial [Actinobacteria bacterium]|nr:transcriptional regulator [Actinomycetota bacterium]
VREAAEAYPGPLLPGSESPFIERARYELDGWMRQAVITSEDPDALWAWVRSSSGDDDLLAWQRLLAAVDYADPRRSLAVSRTRTLRQELKLQPR